MINVNDLSNATNYTGISLPFVTVIVPSIFTRKQQLERCISALLRSDYSNFEILVVDNRPTPPTKPPDWVMSSEKIRVLHQPIPGISAARNLGLAKARGSIVAFTDDDVVVDAQWLRALVNNFTTRDDIACVTGLVLPLELDTVAQYWFEEYFGGFNRGTETKLYIPIHPVRQRLLAPSGVHRVLCISLTKSHITELSLYEAIVRCGAGANMAFRTGALQDAGGFDLALGTGTITKGGEDLAIFATILSNGGRIIYDPTAIVYHSHRQSYDELVNQVNGSGLGLTAMLTSLVHKDVRHLFIMAERLPSALRSIIKRQFFNNQEGYPRNTTATKMPPTYPKGLRLHELFGMAKGPLAYTLSRRTMNHYG